MSNNQNNRSVVPLGFHHSSPSSLPPQAAISYGSYAGTRQQQPPRGYPPYPPYQQQQQHHHHQPYRQQILQQQQQPYHHHSRNQQHYQQQQPKNWNKKRPHPPPQSSPPTKAARHDNNAAKDFPCDVCQVSLPTRAAWQAHVDSHIQCQHCPFRASPKVVKAHYETQHGRFASAGFKTVVVQIPGCPVQRFRICVGNRPQDVAAWIAQRRQRFPRQKKAAESQTTTTDSTDTTTTDNAQTKQPKETETSGGLASLLEGYGSSSDENEAEENALEQEPQANHNNSIDLSSNKNTTRMDHDDANTTTTATSTKTAKDNSATTITQKNGDETIPPEPNRQQRGLCHAFAKHGRCRRGSQCPYVHDKETKTTTTRPIPHYLQAWNDSSSASESSLLHKLLQKERERETNVTLNLLQYLVKTNFLQDDDNSNNNNGEDMAKEV